MMAIGYLYIHKYLSTRREGETIINGFSLPAGSNESLFSVCDSHSQRTWLPATYVRIIISTISIFLLFECVFNKASVYVRPSICTALFQSCWGRIPSEWTKLRLLCTSIT